MAEAETKEAEVPEVKKDFEITIHWDSHRASVDLKQEDLSEEFLEALSIEMHRYQDKLIDLVADRDPEALNKEYYAVDRAVKNISQIDTIIDKLEV